MSRCSRAEIVGRLTRRMEEIMKMPPLEVAQTLALHLSIDPHFLNASSIYIVQCMSKNRDATLEEQIAKLFEDIFLTPIYLEASTARISNGPVDGFLYPFGADRSLLSFPFRLFRSSVTAYACVARLLNEPGQVPEGSSFGTVKMSSENSMISYSNFQYNATFNAVFSRFSLVCSLCASLCATSRVAQASNAGSSDFKLMRVMIHGALTRLATTLADVEAAKSKKYIDAETLRRVAGLVTACSSLETFNSEAIMDLAAKHYKELCQKHKVRVGNA